MYQWLAQSLGNVSVNRKLGLGFGLVLLLTLAITLTGWHGMDSIIDRGDKLGTSRSSSKTPRNCASPASTINASVTKPRWQSWKRP